MVNKEVVIFCIDANYTMEEAYPPQGPSTTRMNVAKQLVHDMVADLMLRSKTHEAGVVMVKTRRTQHHKCIRNEDEDSVGSHEDEHVPFPDMTELVDNLYGIERPSADFLRQLRKMKISSKKRCKQLEGNLYHAIGLAADSIFMKTSGKKYRRRIMVFTDAKHHINVDSDESNQLLVLIDSLRAMECQLDIIILDSSLHIEAPSLGGDAKIKAEDRSAVKSEDDDEDQSSEQNLLADDSVDDSGGDNRGSMQKENLKFLVDLSEKTGGRVLQASELQQDLQKTIGRRRVKSTRYTFIFHIAPGLVIDTAKYCLILAKPTSPKLVKRVMESGDDEENVEVAASQAWTQTQSAPSHDVGEYTSADTGEFQRMYTHWDPEVDGREISGERLAQAYRYGSDLVAIGDFDIQGLVRPSPKILKMLGYLKAEKVPRSLLIGPPYAITGADSRKACAAISALARALRRLDKVGVATMVKTKDHDPILVGVFPLEEGDDPIHLVFVQLPFKGDVKNLSTLPSFHDMREEESGCVQEQNKACDDLIDSLMLPHDALDYTKIPTPGNMSFQRTLARRVLDDEAEPYLFRKEGADPMITPKEIVETAKPCMQTFRDLFPLSKVKQASSETKRRGATSYRNFLEEE